MNKDMREIFGMKLWSRPEYFDPRRIRAREDFQPEIQTLILKKKKKIVKRLLSKKFVKIQTLLATPKMSRIFFVIFFTTSTERNCQHFKKKIIQQKSRLPRFRQRNYKVQKIGSLAIWHNILGIV